GTWPPNGSAAPATPAATCTAWGHALRTIGPAPAVRGGRPPAPDRGGAAGGTAAAPPPRPADPARPGDRGPQGPGQGAGPALPLGGRAGRGLAPVPAGAAGTQVLGRRPAAGDR